MAVNCMTGRGICFAVGLTYLDLFYTWIEAAGAQALGEGLRHNSTLTTLALGLFMLVLLLIVALLHFFICTSASPGQRRDDIDKAMGQW